MGLPSVNISFTEKAASSVNRGARGVVALVLRETTEPATNPITIIDESDIPSSLSAKNVDYIKKAMIGYVNTPRKILVYVLKSSLTTYATAFTALAKEKFDYLAIPTVATDNLTADVVTWVKAQRTNGNLIKAVLPNTVGDSEGIINYATDSVTVGSTTYTAEQYTPRIAGIIAGTPLTISCTFAPLTEATDCTRLSKADMDTAINAGKLIAFYDGEKVKLARGINSLTTTTEDKGGQFKKIKIVETMDMISDDIKKTAQDSYLGKFANSYDNKCLLIGAVGAYFDQLKLDGIISSYTVEVDVSAQRVYLASKGKQILVNGTLKNVEDCTDDEIKAADTDDQVFLKSTLRILDAIEDITIAINI